MAKNTWHHCPGLVVLPVDQLVEQPVIRLQVQEKGVALLGMLEKIKRYTVPYDQSAISAWTIMLNS